MRRERKAPIRLLETVDSTNDRLKELARNGEEEGFILAAREQTGGRGRLGRSFASPPGGLYLSLLLCPDCPAEQCATLTPLAAVAVRRAVENCAGVSCGIKWPNDLQLNGKKLCGILTELLTDGGERPRVVVGVGLNVNTPRSAFPPELRDTAGSLYTETGKRVDPEELLWEIASEMDALYARWREDRTCCLEEYRAACLSTGRAVYLLQNGQRREAFAEGVNPDFSLEVRFPDGTKENVRFGEVSLRV